MAIFNQQIEVQRPRRVASVYSTEDDVLTWEFPERVHVPFKVSVQPSDTTEGDEHRPQTVSTWRLYTPPGRDLDLRAEDRVVLGGTLPLQVVGEPQKWPDPLRPGHVHHVEARLEVVRG